MRLPGTMQQSVLVQYSGGMGTRPGIGQKGFKVGMLKRALLNSLFISGPFIMIFPSKFRSVFSIVDLEKSS